MSEPMLADDSTETMTDAEAALLRAKMLHAAADALDAYNWDHTRQGVTCASNNAKRAELAKKQGFAQMRKSDFSVSQMPDDIGDTLYEVVNEVRNEVKEVQEEALREAAREIVMDA